MIFASSGHIKNTIYNAWSSLLGSTPKYIPTKKAIVPIKIFLTGIIHISGTWTGAILLSVDEHIANYISSKFLSCDVDLISEEDVFDSIGELTNIIGGNLKIQLSGDNHLSLPSIISGKEFKAFIASSKLISEAFFSCTDENGKEGHFQVRVYSKEEEA